MIYKKSLKPELYNKGKQAVSYLLEGSFTSMYKNRILPKGMDESKFKEVGAEGAIIVCADGDMIINEFNLKTGAPLDLGVDAYKPQVTYANKEFILNSLEYLLNDKGIITAKAKEIKLRPLDKIKVAEEKTKWQVINLLLPIVLLILYGIGRQYFRKKKYARF
jgi:ABC-2 type transport system permease protein